MTIYRNGKITPEYEAARKKMFKPDGTMTDAYRDSLIHQTLCWMAGNPVHNNLSDECCQDFSCCAPELLFPEPKKARDWDT